MPPGRYGRAARAGADFLRGGPAAHGRQGGRRTGGTPALPEPLCTSVAGYTGECGAVLAAVKRGRIRKDVAATHINALNALAMRRFTPDDFAARAVCNTVVLHASLRVAPRQLFHWLAPRVAAVAPALPAREVASLLWAYWTLDTSSYLALTALGDRLADLARRGLLTAGDAARACAPVAGTNVRKSHPVLLDMLCGVLVGTGRGVAAGAGSLGAVGSGETGIAARGMGSGGERGGGDGADGPSLDHLQQAFEVLARYYFPSRGTGSEGSRGSIAGVAPDAPAHIRAAHAAHRVNTLLWMCEDRHAVAAAAGRTSSRRLAYLIHTVAEYRAAGIALRLPLPDHMVRAFQGMTPALGGDRASPRSRAGPIPSSRLAAILVKAWRTLAASRGSHDTRGREAVAAAFTEYVRAVFRAGPTGNGAEHAHAGVSPSKCPVPEATSPHGHTSSRDALSSIFTKIDAASADAAAGDAANGSGHGPPPSVTLTPSRTLWVNTPESVTRQLPMVMPLEDVATILANVDTIMCGDAVRMLIDEGVRPHLPTIGADPTIAARMLAGVGHVAKHDPQYAPILSSLAAIVATTGHTLDVSVAVRALMGAVKGGCLAPRLLATLVAVLKAPPYPEVPGWLLKRIIAVWTAVGAREELAALYVRCEAQRGGRMGLVEQRAAVLHHGLGDPAVRCALFDACAAVGVAITSNASAAGSACAHHVHATADPGPGRGAGENAVPPTSGDGGPAGEQNSASHTLDPPPYACRGLASHELIAGAAGALTLGHEDLDALEEEMLFRVCRGTVTVGDIVPYIAACVRASGTGVSGRGRTVLRAVLQRLAHGAPSAVQPSGHHRDSSLRRFSGPLRAEDTPTLLTAAAAWGEHALVVEVLDRLVVCDGGHLDAAPHQLVLEAGHPEAYVDALLALLKYWDAGGDTAAPCYTVVELFLTRLLQSVGWDGDGGDAEATAEAGPSPPPPPVPEAVVESVSVHKVVALARALASRGLSHPGVLRFMVHLYRTRPAHAYPLSVTERYHGILASAEAEGLDGALGVRYDAHTRALLREWLHVKLTNGFALPSGGGERADTIWTSVLDPQSIFGRTVLAPAGMTATSDDGERRRGVSNHAPRHGPPSARMHAVPLTLPGTAAPEAMAYAVGDDLVLQAARGLAW